MADPTKFKGSNAELQAPPNMTDEQCGTLPVMQISVEGLPTSISCWKLTPEELKQTQRTACVWIGVVGVNHPPIFVSGIMPFQNPEDPDCKQCGKPKSAHFDKDGKPRYRHQFIAEE